MESFERNILNHRESLDGVDPAPGHEQRFIEKLNKNSIRRHSAYGWIIAASIAVLMAIGILATQTSIFRQDITLSDISVEFKEAEWYYQHEFHKKLDELSTVLSGNPNQERSILAEINHMDAMYFQLEQDIQKNPDDPRALNALINYYQTKIDFIDQVLTQINEFENINHKRYENTNI